MLLPNERRRPFGKFTTGLPTTLATFPLWPGYWQDFGPRANGHSSNLGRRQMANACSHCSQGKWAFSNVATFRQMTACQMCQNIRVTVEKHNLALYALQDQRSLCRISWNQQQDPGIEVIWQNQESLTFSGRAEMDFAKYATLQVLYFYFSFNLIKWNLAKQTPRWPHKNETTNS